jgi:dephospho-CoA kinase
LQEIPALQKFKIELMKSQRIIAILGLPGSGKSVVIEYLMKKYAWPKIYFGDVTFDEMRRLKLEINEKNERKVREGLRKKYGDLVYVERVVDKIEKLSSAPIVLLESMYSWEEYLFLKKKFGEKFQTIAVCASPEKRYARLAKRKVRPLNLQEARSRDYSQIENLQQAGPIAMANHVIVNDSTKKELYSKIEKIFNS